MGTLINFQRKSPLIPKEEWNSFVNLTRDILLAEKVLKRMKAEYSERQRHILSKLGAGAAIENGGKVAL